MARWTDHACDAPRLDVHIQTRRHGGCLLGGRVNGRLLEVANPGRVREFGSATRPSLINTVGSNREGQLISTLGTTQMHVHTQTGTRMCTHTGNTHVCICKHEHANAQMHIHTNKRKQVEKMTQ